VADEAPGVADVAGIRAADAEGVVVAEGSAELLVAQAVDFAVGVVEIDRVVPSIGGERVAVLDAVDGPRPGGAGVRMRRLDEPGAQLVVDEGLDEEGARGASVVVEEVEPPRAASFESEHGRRRVRRGSDESHLREVAAGQEGRRRFLWSVIRRVEEAVRELEDRRPSQSGRSAFPPGGGVVAEH